MEESKKVYVHYEGTPGPEYTHVAKITWGLTVEQLAVEFARVYNEKHGRMVSLDPAMIHLLNGKRRISKSANLLRIVKDKSDIFVERDIPTTAGLDIQPSVQPNLSQVKVEDKSPKSVKQTAVKLPVVETRRKIELGSVFDQQQELRLESDLALAVKSVQEVGQELQEPFICAVIVGALKAQQLQKYNFAICVFSKVLQVLPKQPICLRGLGSMALAVQNYLEAHKWLQLGVQEYPRDILFHARLGNAYSGLGKYPEAMKEYELALIRYEERKFLTFPPEDEVKLPDQSMLLSLTREFLDEIHYDPRLVCDPNAGDVLGAITEDGLNISSAAVLGKMGEVKQANTILKTILSENSQNVDALYVYGTLNLTNGFMREGLKIFIQLLMSEPKDKRFRSGLATAIMHPKGMEIIKTEVAVEPKAARPLDFLATCVRDYGGLHQAEELYNLAVKFSPSSVSFYLRLMQLYEVMYEYLKALGLAASLFDTCPSFSLNKISFSDVIPYFEGPNWSESPDNIAQQCDLPVLKFQSRIEFFRWFDLPALKQAINTGSNSLNSTEETKKWEIKCSYDAEQLDGLAVLFTLTRILFVGGSLDRAKQLARLVEPARISSATPLQQTTIRNEHAYFTSVQKILEQHPVHLPLPSMKDQGPLYLAGDSHCMSAAWRTVRLRGQNRLLVPMLVTGLKVWHLRPECQFYPKHAFENAMQSVADGAQLVMVFGEIDCRDGIRVSVEKGIYKNLECAIEFIVNLYLDVLQQLIILRGFEFFVHPVPPVLNDTRTVVLFFNKILKAKLEGLKEKSIAGSKRLHWLDFVPDLLTTQGLLREEFKLDGTHLSPKYSTLLQRELRKVK